MNEHTPGPWMLRFDGDDDDGHSEVRVHCVGHDGEECDVAEVCHQAPNSSAEFMANARLLAAAPDLLAVCKAFIGKLGPGGYYPGAGATLTEQMRAAIAKAGG